MEWRRTPIEDRVDRTGVYAGRFARTDQFSPPLLIVQHTIKGATHKGAIFLYTAHAVLILHFISS